jgi:hypothetical protein
VKNLASVLDTVFPNAALSLWVSFGISIFVRYIVLKMEFPARPLRKIRNVKIIIKRPTMIRTNRRL